LPATLKTLGAGALSGLSKLASLTLPASLTSIGNYIDAYSSKLTSVTFPASMAAVIGGDTFFGHVTYTVTGDTSGDGYSFSNGILMRKTGTEVAVLIGKDATGAVVLPSAVTSIGAGAFKGSAITSVDASAATGLKAIEGGAFVNCAQLAWVRWPVSPANAMLGSSGDVSVFRGCVLLEKIELPDHLSGIYDYSFADDESWSSSLPSLTIVALNGQTVPSFGYYGPYGGGSIGWQSFVDGLQFYVPDTALTAYTSTIESGWDETYSFINGTTPKNHVVSISALVDLPANW
jgi:hypothetical protein